MAVIYVFSAFTQTINVFSIRTEIAECRKNCDMHGYVSILLFCKEICEYISTSMIKLEAGNALESERVVMKCTIC